MISISTVALEWPPLRLQHLLIPERLPVLSVTKGLECRPDGTLVPIPAAPAAAPTAEEAPAVTAPLVGTFYAAPAPEQPPFAMPGDKVKKGQTVCLIEAMKTMIEVPAPCDCVIEEVLKANGELAAFGEALMRYRPC